MLIISPFSSSSCQFQLFSTMFTQRTSPFFHKLHRLPFHFHFASSHCKFRCLLDQFAPNLAVSSSANVIAASATVASSGSSSLHGAVASAITQVAVTAVAIASGACLSTKVDFLWPKVEEQPGALILEGVDVTGYPILNDPEVFHLKLASGFVSQNREELKK